MAIFSVSVSSISRTAGRSATAAAAYRTGTVVIDERQGLIHDYSRRGGVDHVSRHYPHGIKDVGTEALWNLAEHAEVKRNAMVAREVLVALPHELDATQRRALSEAICEALVERYQTAVEGSVHRPDKDGDHRNEHVHIEMLTRHMNADGSLDGKIQSLSDIKGGSSKETEWIREMVEIKTNLALEHAGLDVRVDRRRLKVQQAEALENGDLALAQSLDRAPQQHEGPRVTQIRRECEKAGRAPLGALDIAAANDAIGYDADRLELAEVVSMIEHLEKHGAERTAAHVEAIKEKRLRDLLTAARAELKSTEKERIELAIKLDEGEPGYVQEARNMRKDMVKAKAAAQAFREENVWFSKFADVVGIKLETDRAAEYATAKFVKSPERRQAKAWTSEYKEDDATYKKLVKDEAAFEARVSRLDAQVSALNKPDPEVIEQIKTEVAAGIERACPEIAAFVDNHRPQIGSAAEIGAGIDAWISTDIISTGNLVIDELSRKGAQFRSRMLREEMQRAEENERLSAQAVRKYQAAFKKALDGAFKSAAREAEPKIDHAAESRKRAVEAAAAALRAPQQAAKAYVPTWKREHDTNLKYEP